MKITILHALIVMIALAPNAMAQQLGDPEAGLSFAEKVCAECHSVTKEEFLSPNPIARSFRDIANTPGMNERALSVWFRTPHPTMPNFILKIQNEDDIIAYITSLRSKTDP